MIFWGHHILGFLYENHLWTLNYFPSGEHYQPLFSPCICEEEYMYNLLLPKVNLLLD
jgi:hypothetical protein